MYCYRQAVAVKLSNKSYVVYCERMLSQVQGEQGTRAGRAAGRSDAVFLKLPVKPRSSPFHSSHATLNLASTISAERATTTVPLVLPPLAQAAV